MEVAVFDQASWRYAQRRDDEIDLSRLAAPTDWREEIRRILSDKDELSQTLDMLLSRKPGFHSTLAKQATTSDVMRRLRYARELVLSLHLGHHTGRKGGVAAVNLQARLPHAAITCLPNWADIPNCSVTVNREGSSTYSGNRSDKEYEIHVDAGQDLITPKVTASAARYCIEALASNLRPKVQISFPTFFMVAIDFMFNEFAIPIPIEVHVPARSTGPAGLAHSISYDTEPHAWLAQDADLGMLVPIPDPKLNAEPFHQLDVAFARQLVSKIDDSTGRSIPWSLEAGLEGDTLHIGGIHMNAATLKRSVLQTTVAESLGYQEPEYVTVQPGDITGLLNATERWGWVVIKDNRNLPWWHAESRQVRFIAGPKDPGMTSVLDQLSRHELLIEPLVARSDDSRGRSGELRIFGYMMADGAR